MLDFFGAKNGKASSRAVRNKHEFDDIAILPEYASRFYTGELLVSPQAMHMKENLMTDWDISGTRNIHGYDGHSVAVGSTD